MRKRIFGLFDKVGDDKLPLRFGNARNLGEGNRQHRVSRHRVFRFRRRHGPRTGIRKLAHRPVLVLDAIPVHVCEGRNVATVIKGVGPDEQRRVRAHQLQRVAIAGVLAMQPGILVLDEPTASITDKESRILFQTVKDLKSKGMGIIYISHRMAELFEIGDRVTVLRDGCYVGTNDIADIDEAQLTRSMVGRDISFAKVANPCRTNEVVMEVRNLNYRDKVKDVSFDLHKGEILGFSGLVGAGRTEIAKCIIGAYRHSGSIKYMGKELPSNVADTARCGVVYLSEDRKGEGLVLPHSLYENIALPNLEKIAKPLVRKNKMVSIADGYIDKLKIKAFSSAMEAGQLSGGNQQKVVISKWLYSDADVYIFDEPTRGIDVGARDEIYDIMQQLLEKGASIILISSDLVEVIRLSDRIAVMREGELSAILENDETITQEKVLSYAF